MQTTRWFFFEGLFSASLSFLPVSFPRAPLQVIDGERTARLIKEGEADKADVKLPLHVYCDGLSSLCESHFSHLVTKKKGNMKGGDVF